MTFIELLDTTPMNLHIHDSLLKAHSVLGRHRRIAVSVSGGSDSDTILDLIEAVKPDDCELRQCLAVALPCIGHSFQLYI